MIKKEEILEYIQRHPLISSSELARYFKVTRVAMYYHVKKLVEENKIYAQGNKNATRYSAVFSNTPENLPNNFFVDIKTELIEAYDGLEDINIQNLLTELLSYLKADGSWLYGMNAFEEIIRKENQGQTPNESLLAERLKIFIFSFLEQERKRRKNGFFYGTNSMKHILASYEAKIFIDEIIFTQIATLSRFGRLRGANEIYWGKKSQDKALLSAGISRGIDVIINYVKDKNIHYAIFTPPTIKRVVQFRDVLRELLKKHNIFFTEIACNKKQQDFKTLKPQKDTKGLDRIINARSSMILGNIKDFLHIPEIVIFDDNFTTGATINGIAEMMRFQGYTGTITAITLTGNFEYIPGLTDEGDI